MDILNYYASHSMMTDPRENIGFYHNLPRDLSQLAKLIHHITIHFQYIQESGGNEVVGRIHEIYIRKVSDRLKKLNELGVTCLQGEYDFLRRTICTCRDFALLLCSMLRHINVPSRVRYGFAQYLDWDKSFYFDHTIVEYWDEEVGIWKLIERYLKDETKKRFNITFDTNDVPRDKFITAAEAWLNCRAGKADPDTFGTGYARRRSGLWYLRNKLIQDLAALNKMEMLPSDLWGYMVDNKVRHTLSFEEALLMDELASYLINPDENLLLLKNIYLNNSLLKLGNQVYRARINGKYLVEHIST